MYYIERGVYRRIVKRKMKKSDDKFRQTVYLSPELKLMVAQRARVNRRSFSSEAVALIEEGIESSVRMDLAVIEAMKNGSIKI